MNQYPTYTITGYDISELKEHPFLNYIEFINADITKENWPLQLLSLARWISSDWTIIAGVIAPFVDFHVKDESHESPKKRKLVLGYPYGDEPSYQGIKQLQADLRSTLEAFLHWARTGDSKAAQKSLKELEIWDEISSDWATWELAVDHPGLNIFLNIDTIARRVFFDLADFLRTYNWHDVLGQCAYDKCKIFFIKSRSDQRFCSPSHRAMAWEPYRKASRQK